MEVLRELKKIEVRSQKQGSWFSTHPPLSERIQRCEAEMRQYPDAKSLACLPARYKEVDSNTR